MRFVIGVAILTLTGSLSGQVAADNSNARPPVNQTDLEIVKRASEILNSPAKWNRADNRVCPEAAKTFSIYCALEKATTEKSGQFEHRGAAMQEARFVIEDVAPNVKSYQHRLMNYNNDPSTTFADVQKVFRLLQERIAKRLAAGTETKPAAVAPRAEAPTAQPPVSMTDLKVLERARALLDSSAKWDRADNQVCDKQAHTISLFCAFQLASIEVTGAPAGSGAAIEEARELISEMDPQRLKYRARLTDFNNDPGVTFADVQKLFRTVEKRLRNRMKGK